MDLVTSIFEKFPWSNFDLTNRDDAPTGFWMVCVWGDTSSSHGGFGGGGEGVLAKTLQCPSQYK